MTCHVVISVHMSHHVFCLHTQHNCFPTAGQSICPARLKDEAGCSWRGRAIEQDWLDNKSSLRNDEEARCSLPFLFPFLPSIRG